MIFFIIHFGHSDFFVLYWVLIHCRILINEYSIGPNLIKKLLPLISFDFPKDPFAIFFVRRILSCVLLVLGVIKTYYAFSFEKVGNPGT